MTEKETSNDENLGCFGRVRQSAGQAITLEIRFKTRDAKAVPYSFIVDYDFDASGKITLETHKKRVIIEGLHLEQLWNYINQHRVTWVQEPNRTDLQPKSGGDSPFIRKVSVEDIG